MKVNENKIVENDVNLNTDEALARGVVHLLDERAQHLNAVTLKKLENARHQAVEHLLAKQASGINQSGHVLQLFGLGAYFDQHRMLAVGILMCAGILAFLSTQQVNNERSPVVVAYQESSDAFLLASELPPEAFADKGFDTWVVSKRD